MWVLLLPLTIIVLVGSYLATYANSRADEIAQAVEAEVALYRVFVSAANDYFKITSAPLVKTRYSWSDFNVSAASAISRSSMNPTWTAVRKPDGVWAACTEMREEAAAMVGTLFPSPEVGEMGTTVVDVGLLKPALSVGGAALAIPSADLCKGP